MTKETMELISIMQSQINQLNELKSKNFNDSQMEQLDNEIQMLQNRIKLYE